MTIRIKRRTVSKLSDGESVVTTYYSHGVVCCSLQKNEDVDEEIQQTIKYNNMDLITAQKKIAEKTGKMKKDKVLFLAVVKDGEEEGEVIIQDKLDETCIAAYANGVEVPLPKMAPESLKETKKSNTVMKTATKKSAKNSVTKKVEKAVAAKKSAKTAKKAPAKKDAKEKVKREVSFPEVKAASISEGIKAAKKDGLSKAKLVVKGKEYGLRIANTWAVMKSVVEAGKDGFVNAVGNGYYLYEKKNHKEIFEGIFASNSYKVNGAYAISKLPAVHAEYFSKI